MKNTYKILLITIMLLAIILAFAACNDDDVKTSLDNPTNIAASGSTISWSAVDGATSYDIIVKDAEAKNTENTYYNLDLTEIGSYLIKIRAVGKNSQGTVIYSDYVEYTFVKSDKLATPTVTVNDKLATWASVENAASYNVRVVDSSSTELYSGTQSELSYSFDNEKYTSVGKYTIQVKAIPEATKSEYANSDAGLGYYIVTSKLSAPSISSVSSTAVRWTSISGISSYKLYLYEDDGTLVSTYTTTSNSYAFSYMKLDNYGKYYCRVQAIGDGEVYLDSEVGERVPAYDLLVIPTIDETTVDLYQDASGTWKLKFEVENTNKLSSITITLTTTKADSSSSMSAIEKTLEMIQGESEYTIVSDADFNAALTYYVKNTSASGYIKNTKPYDALQTYFTFDGVEFKKATVSALSSVIEYYVKVGNPGADYYEEAKGAVSYTEVNKDTAAFNTRNNYYTKEADVYTLVTSTYVDKGDFAALNPQDTTSVYLKDNGDGTYTKLGTYTQIEDETLAHYWVYKSFTAFDSNTTYYTASYEEFGSADYSADTFYKLVKTTFDTSIDDLFFEVDTSGNYTYKKTDIAYYGRIFDITVSATGIKDSIITGKSIDVDGNYISFRHPNKVDKDLAWTASPLQGYFKTEAEYTAFVTEYDDYYAVESIGDLQYMQYDNDGAKYVLMQDLDAEGYYWAPIDSFTDSILDGNNHKISNIVYARIDGRAEALISESSGASILDLYIVDASNEADATEYCAGIIGDAYDTQIKNCYVKAKFSTATSAGGIIAKGKMVYITNCQTLITIENVAISAGIAAYGEDLELKGCIASGSIDVDDVYFSLGDFDAMSNNAHLEDYHRIYILQDSKYVYVGEFRDKDTVDFKDDDGEYYEEYFLRITELSEGVVAAGLVSGLEGGSIDNSIAQVSITIDAPTMPAYAGGAVAMANHCTITNTFAGNKYSKNNPDRMNIVVNGLHTIVGGFVGETVDATIDNCYTTIRVSAKENLGGFVGKCSDDLNNTGSQITNCYSTGGVADQISTNKGYFVGYMYDTHTTITNCYIYDWEHATVHDDHATTAASLDAIKTAINEAKAGSLATITGYLEPTLIDVAYASAYTDSIKASGKINVKAYLAVYDSTTQETTIIDMYADEEKVDQIVIGDKSAKGTILVVLQQKVDENNDGVDDGTGARVVIYITVS